MNNNGSLELIIGPMFSGKSTELIRQIRRRKTINKKVLVIKPAIDTRYNNKLTSHNFESENCVVLDNLKDIETDEINKHDTIVIDEGQFFTDLKENVINWVDTQNKDVIIGGLDGDFERKPMGQILDLIPHADKYTKLRALCKICNDGTDAIFSKRKINVSNNILIGGEESYIPVCRKHYFNNTI